MKINYSLADPAYHKILDQYLQTIKLPDAKLEIPIHVVPVGLVGAGKTTILKKFCQYFPLVRISGDEIREYVYGAGQPDSYTWPIGRDLAEYFAAQGYSIAHDTDGATDATRNSVETLIKKFGGKYFYFYVNPPEDYILTKLKNHPPSYLFKTTEEALAAYERRKPVHQNIRDRVDFFYEFDPSKDNLEEQLEEALKVLTSLL